MSCTMYLRSLIVQMMKCFPIDKGLCVDSPVFFTVTIIRRISKVSVDSRHRGVLVLQAVFTVGILDSTIMLCMFYVFGEIFEMLNLRIDRKISPRSATDSRLCVYWATNVNLSTTQLNLSKRFPYVFTVCSI